MLGNKLDLLHLSSNSIYSIQLQVIFDEFLYGRVGSHHFLYLCTHQEHSNKSWFFRIRGYHWPFMLLERTKKDSSTHLVFKGWYGSSKVGQWQGLILNQWIKALLVYDWISDYQAIIIVYEHLRRVLVAIWSVVCVDCEIVHYDWLGNRWLVDLYEMSATISDLCATGIKEDTDGYHSNKKHHLQVRKIFILIFDP